MFETVMKIKKALKEPFDLKVIFNAGGDVRLRIWWYEWGYPLDMIFDPDPDFIEEFIELAKEREKNHMEGGL